MHRLPKTASQRLKLYNRSGAATWHHWWGLISAIRPRVLGLHVAASFEPVHPTHTRQMPPAADPAETTGRLPLRFALLGRRPSAFLGWHHTRLQALHKVE